MLLVIDAGNTNITLGAYKDRDLVFVSRLSTEKNHTADQFAMDLNSVFVLNKMEGSSFKGAIISSVVPEITRALMTATEKVTGCTPLVLGPGVKTGLNIRIDDPSVLGADLVATAVAALNKYELPCLIADLGTATKVSAISADGAYLGCSIAPGVSLSLNALANGASQLSSISLKVPDHSIGTNTLDSMRSGLIYATVDGIDGIFDRMEAEMGTKVNTFVATGGLGGILTACKHEVVSDPNLILEGLRIIYDKNNSSASR